MATGDIVGAVVSADGWYVELEIENLTTEGTYDFGLSGNNDPTNAKIKITITSPGYVNGVLSTKQRSIVGVPCTRPSNTGAMRRAYPNQSLPDEQLSGSNVIIKVALSDVIYSDDTATINVSSGWYTQGGTSNAMYSGLLTNNSTANYPKIVGNWATEQCKLIEGSNIHLEFLAYHKFAEQGKQVPSVVFTVTDGINSVEQTVTTMTISDDSPFGKIIVYQADINLSSLNSGLCSAEAVAYPWIGNESSILNTDDGINIFPTPLYTNLTFRLDKTGLHGHTCIDLVSGNDTTGSVYDSQVNAESGQAFATISAALTALQEYHNINAGHNDAGGGTVYLSENTYQINTSNGGETSTWVTFTRKSNAAKENVIVRAVSTNSVLPQCTRFYDVTFIATNTYFFKANKISLDKCILNTTSYSIYEHYYGVILNCTGLFADGLGQFSNYRKNWALIRGNEFSSSGHSCYGYVMIGNKGILVRQRTNPESAMPFNDNLIIAYNILGNYGTINAIILANNENIIHGAAIVQNLVIRYGIQTEALVGISADGTTTHTNHIIIHGNSLIGARANLGYNDIPSGGPYSQTNWSVKNNIFSNYNCKDDTFQSNPLAYGGWAVGYGVGFSGNHFRTTAGDEWLGEFQGLHRVTGSWSTPLNPEYVDDQSADGGNTSGGDYHLQSNSPAIGISYEQLLPYDLDGIARYSGGAAGAYEYGTPPQPTKPQSFKHDIKGTLRGFLRGFWRW